MASTGNTGASWRSGATRFQSAAISATSFQVAGAILIEPPTRRRQRIGTECVRIVPMRVNAGTPRGPDSRRSIERLPASTVINTGAVGCNDTNARSQYMESSSAIVGIAVRRMDLQISGVTGADLAPVDVRAPLADPDATHDHSVSLGDSNPPPLTLEAVEREEAGPAVDAKADVANHWAGRGQCNQTLVVRGLRVTNDKIVARRADAGRDDFERGDWCS